MASLRDTTAFFLEGNAKQFDHVLKLYPQALKLKAEKKTRKPEELIKLDNWYQNELPKKIKERGKDAHLLHEELVQLMKWKQSRGKCYPQLSNLIKVNTPRAVVQETKKAFKKLPNIEQAITALSNLKGVGTTTASALLAAADPEIAPFMADECLKAIPEMEGIDYTAKEYLNFVKHIRETCERLNKEQNGESTPKWSPHLVELAVWAHFVMSELQPDLLGIGANGSNGGGVPLAETSDESNLEPPHLTNGNLPSESVDEATTSCTEDSLDKAASPLPETKRTPETVEGSSEENSLGVEEEEDDEAPPSKKARPEQ